MGDLTALQWVFIIVVGLVLLFAVLGNIMVVMIVVRTTRMRTVTNALICNLAISDIFLAAFILPQNLHDISHTEDYDEGLFACKLVNCMPVFCIMSSIGSLVAISFERHRGIVQSLKPQITIFHCKIIIAASWISAILLAMPSGWEYSEYRIEDPYNSNSTINTCGSDLAPPGFGIINGFGILLISYVLPLVTITTNYTRIMMFVWREGRRDNNNDPNSGHKMKTVLNKNRVKIIRMLILVVVLFALSWLPYFAVLLYAKISHNDATADSSSAFSLVRLFLSAFSTAYNSVVYVIFNQDFRAGFSLLLLRRRRPNAIRSQGNSVMTADTVNIDTH